MNNQLHNSNGHSADVRIQLHVNGHVLAVTQLGPDFLVLKNPVNHPPMDAEIAMSVDGLESRWEVRLVQGITVEERKTMIACKGK
jgi:hypothetical protein